MRKILLVAIGFTTFLCGGAVIGDPVDNFAKALKNIFELQESRSGSLGSERESREEREKWVSSKDPFYKLTLDARIDDLDARWKKKSQLSDADKQLLEKQTTDTLILTVSTMFGDGIKIIREVIGTLPNLEQLAEMPLEDLADLVFLLKQSLEQILTKEYREDVEKVFWIAKCLGTNEAGRAAAVSSGVAICKVNNCISGKQCVAVLGDRVAKILKPFVMAVVDGVEADGRHIKGIIDNITGLALLAGESLEAKQLKRFGKFLKLAMRMGIELSKSAKQAEKTRKGHA